MKGCINKALLLSVITVVALFLRFYHLDANPPGLSKDEVFLADISYKILETGRDFQENYLPLSPLRYSAVPALKIYPVAFSIWVFGFNEFAVRFLSALSGVLVVLLAYFLARRLFDENTALVASLLAAFSPWGVTYSRMYLGVMQFTLLFTFGLYLLARGLDGDRRLVLLASVPLGLTFFTYYLSHLFVVVFLALFHFLFMGEVRKAGKTREYYLLLAIVFVSLVVTTIDSRLNVIVPVPPPTAVGVITSFMHNLREEVEVIMLAKGGWDWPYYTSVSGVFYPVLLPFLLAGILLLLKEGGFRSLLPVYWLIMSLAVGAITSNLFVGSLRRALTCAGPAGEIIIAFGLVRILGFYGKNLRIAGLLALLAAAGFTLGVCQFLGHYFVTQPGLPQTEAASMTPARDVFSYAESVREKYGLIVFTRNFDTTLWDNSNMTFDDYRVFYTKRLEPDSKYVFGDVGSYRPGDGNLYIARDFELSNATAVTLFRYSDGGVAYRAVA